ncbi:MAG: metal ABC transporter solute-binding protein, Zn/Mn family [Geminicoccaceae bacterium]
MSRGGKITRRTLLAAGSASLLEPRLARSAETTRLRVGATLHAYFSWVANIVGTAADLVPVIPANADPHSFQPTPEEVRVLSELDAVIVNGLGHDAFIGPMLRAADADLTVINANDGSPLIRDRSSDEEGNGTPNAHSFLSITAAAGQIHHIARSLASLDAANGDLFQENATIYRRRLRHLLAAGLSELDGLDHRAVKIAVVHDGYDYLLSELGLSAHAVVQPRHGIDPSPRQLADTIRRLKESETDILFAEAAYAPRMAGLVAEATGARIERLSHLYDGDYSAGFFEREMAANIETIVRAVRLALADRA